MTDEIGAHRLQQAPAPAEALISRPKGLLDQLLEEGRVHRDFVMAGESYRVCTTFRFEPGGVSFFRSAVLQDGAEVVEDPWGPLFERLGQPDDPGSDPRGARLGFARRALEVHLSRSQQLEQRLELRGTLESPHRSWLHTPVHWGYGASLAALVLAAGAWYGYERWRLLPPELVMRRPSHLLLASVAEGPTAEEPEEEAVETSPKGRAEESRETPAPIGIEPAESAREPVPKKVETPKASPKPKPKLPSPEPPKSRPVAPPEPEPEPEAPPPRSLPAPAERVTRPAPPSPPAPSGLLMGFSPEGLRRLRLVPGTRIFEDANLVLAEVPQTYRQLSCVTTAERRGDGEGGFLIRLRRPTRVFVLHDMEVEKKPEWLEGWRTQGDQVQAMDLDRGKVVDLRIYYKDAEGEALAFGPNTGARRLTKKLRGLAPTNSLVMYLACVREEQ